MTNPLDRVRQAAQGAVTAEEAKVKGWVRTNWKPLAVGFGIGTALCILAHWLF